MLDFDYEDIDFCFNEHIRRVISVAKISKIHVDGNLSESSTKKAAGNDERKNKYQSYFFVDRILCL